MFSMFIALRNKVALNTKNSKKVLLSSNVFVYKNGGDTGFI